MNKLTYKRTLNLKTEQVCRALLMDMLEPSQMEQVKDASGSFPTTHYKNNDTGEVKLGLCAKGIRKIIKRNPSANLGKLITLVQNRYNLNG